VEKRQHAARVPSGTTVFLLVEIGPDFSWTSTSLQKDFLSGGRGRTCTITLFHNDGKRRKENCGGRNNDQHSSIINDSRELALENKIRRK
jgi:hypothetical protein